MNELQAKKDIIIHVYDLDAEVKDFISLLLYENAELTRKYENLIEMAKKLHKENTDYFNQINDLKKDLYILKVFIEDNLEDQYKALIFKDYNN